MRQHLLKVGRVENEMDDGHHGGTPRKRTAKHIT